MIFWCFSGFIIGAMLGKTMFQRVIEKSYTLKVKGKKDVYKCSHCPMYCAIDLPGHPEGRVEIKERE